MMRQADEECPLIPRTAEQSGLTGQLHENLLEHIARVLLVAGEIQQEREQRLGVFVVNPLKFHLNRHSVA